VDVLTRSVRGWENGVLQALVHVRGGENWVAEALVCVRGRENGVVEAFVWTCPPLLKLSVRVAVFMRRAGFGGWTDMYPPKEIVHSLPTLGL
jgi:hypothetical protein